jgi:hypothetical protein
MGEGVGVLIGGEGEGIGVGGWFISWFKVASVCMGVSEVSIAVDKGGASLSASMALTCFVSGVFS